MGQDGSASYVSIILFALIARKDIIYMSEINFQVNSFRRLPSPYKGAPEDAPQMFYALCDVTDLPDDIPMGTNPREQKLTTSVAKQIRNSLSEEAERDFYLLNRGILLSVKDVKYTNATGDLRLTFEDDSVHGNIDGGHTYKIIKELKDKTTPGMQFVKLEILTGVEDIFSKLAAARNTSVQVDSSSIAELEDRFELVKKVLQDEQRITSRLSIKQNEAGDIDITEILAILNLFNLSEYPNNQTDNFPIQSYSGKAKCTDRYINMHKTHQENIENPYVKMAPIMLDLFKLYEKLETNIGDYYAAANQGGKYGSTKGVSGSVNSRKYLSKFLSREMDYSTPTGFIYPLLGALRALIVLKEDGYYDWEMDPFAVMDQLGPKLVSATVDRSRTLGNNPQSVGKDRGHWQTLHMMVRMHFLENRQTVF